jgi:alkylhydroperoxidase/carboxymuconolactone decarboxylase family protein YurZ
MNEDRKDHLTNQEKSLIATGAAMGAGCRTCADKLYAVAVSLRISEEEMRKAFRAGLDAKAQAVETMKAKASGLAGGEKEEDTSPSGKCSAMLESLVRIASLIAANSAPDALLEMEKARREGATPDQLRACVSLAKMVRKNAETFSDQEIFDGMGGLKLDGKAMCCPLPAGQGNTPACSCG